jgi:hypothetical protein
MQNTCGTCKHEPSRYWARTDRQTSMRAGMSNTICLEDVREHLKHNLLVVDFVRFLTTNIECDTSYRQSDFAVEAGMQTT